MFNGKSVSYDPDGNMLSAALDCVTTAFEYDSANRLVKAGDHAYTYNAEDVRIRNLCSGHDTTYTYNTNAKLSQLLMKTTNGVVTKYVYGRGLIGEEKQGSFKTYHFDYRGSTVAITDTSGSITDTFKYDTYGKLIGRTGSSFVIFGYNGRDGVVTDKNGLIYMRARYYSPELRRFVNADVIHGEISDSTTLNRYAFVNGNPVSYVDPFGMDRDNGDASSNTFGQTLLKIGKSFLTALQGFGGTVGFGTGFGFTVDMEAFELTLLAKADGQQIKLNGFDGLDFGKELVNKAGIGINPLSFEIGDGLYHSDLCPYYENGYHAIEDCPNSEIHVPNEVEMTISQGVELYFLVGVTLEIEYDYGRVQETWEEIWSE